MFELQALQTNGTWYVLSKHATRREADIARNERAGHRYGRVDYRIV